jgi:hypothetical protein
LSPPHRRRAKAQSGDPGRHHPKQATQLGLLLPDDVVNFIAENITDNVRQIEGVVKRLTAYKEILNDSITIESVKRAIKDVLRIGPYIPTPDVIIQETARYYAIDPAELRGQRRSKNTAMARQMSMYLMRSLTNLSLKDIGEQYEGRKPLHSPLLHPQGGGPAQDRPGDKPHCPGYLRQHQLPKLTIFCLKVEKVLFKVCCSFRRQISLWERSKLSTNFST